MDILSLLSNISILYIEDNKEKQEEYSNILIKISKNLFLASSGEEALNIIKNQHIDLLISNIDLPDNNAFFILKEIQQLNKQIKSILISSENSYNVLNNCFLLNVDDCLIKPISIKTLLSSIVKISKSLLNEKTVNIQLEELNCLKNNLEKNNIFMKLNDDYSISYINKNFKDLFGFEKFELNDLFIKEKDLMEFMFILQEAEEKHFWEGIFFFKNSSNNQLKFNLQIILEKNFYKDDISFLIVLKDITKEHENNKLIKKTLIKKQSNLFLKNKEFSSQQKVEINNLKIELEEANKKIFKLESDKQKTELFHLDKLKFDKKGMEKTIYNLEKEIRELKKEYKTINTEDFEHTIQKQEIIISNLNQKISDLKDKNILFKEKEYLELKNLNEKLLKENKEIKEALKTTKFKFKF